MTADMDELAVATMRALSVEAAQKPHSVRTFGASAPRKGLAGKLGLTSLAVAGAGWSVLAHGAAA